MRFRIAILEPGGIGFIQIVEPPQADALNRRRVVIAVAVAIDVHCGHLRRVVVSRPGDTVAPNERPELRVVVSEIAELLAEVETDSHRKRVLRAKSVFGPESRGRDALLELGLPRHGSA